MSLPACTHALVVHEERWDGERAELVLWRVCLLCGGSYDRDAWRRRLERAMRDRWRLPSSPWSAQEVAEGDGPDG